MQSVVGGELPNSDPLRVEEEEEGDEEGDGEEEEDEDGEEEDGMVVFPLFRFFRSFSFTPGAGSFAPASVILRNMNRTPRVIEMCLGFLIVVINFFGSIFSRLANFNFLLEF